MFTLIFGVWRQPLRGVVLRVYKKMFSREDGYRARLCEVVRWSTGSSPVPDKVSIHVTITYRTVPPPLLYLRLTLDCSNKNRKPALMCVAGSGWWTWAWRAITSYYNRVLSYDQALASILRGKTSFSRVFFTSFKKKTRNFPWWITACLRAENGFKPVFWTTLKRRLKTLFRALNSLSRSY